jgi:hypothetical protein
MKSIICIGVFIVLFLIGCSSTGTITVKVLTPDFIKKDNSVSFYNRMEATPFIWNNKLYMMIDDRQSEDNSSNPKKYIEIYDENDTLVSRTQTSLSFASAIVDNGTLYVTGSTGDKLSQIKTTDLINWTTPKVVFNGITEAELFNTSIDKEADGSYIMSYETCEPNTKCFNIRFLKSYDLENWAEIGTFYKPNEYAACPTIRVVDGVYYMFYLIVAFNEGKVYYPTYVAKSTDLINWQISDKVILSPLETDGELNNNSDMDLIEKDGKVIINYATGDQITHTNIKRARYNGTLKQLVAEFF